MINIVILCIAFSVNHIIFRRLQVRLKSTFTPSSFQIHVRQLSLKEVSEAAAGALFITFYIFMREYPTIIYIFMSEYLATIYIFMRDSSDS